MDLVTFDGEFQILCDFSKIPLILEQKNFELNGKILFRCDFFSKLNEDKYRKSSYTNNNTIIKTFKEYLAEKYPGRYIFENNFIIKKNYLSFDILFAPSLFSKKIEKAKKINIKTVSFNVNQETVLMEYVDSNLQIFKTMDNIEYKIIKKQIENDRNFVSLMIDDCKVFYNLQPVLVASKSSSKIVFTYNNGEFNSESIDFKNDLQTELFFNEVIKVLKK